MVRWNITGDDTLQILGVGTYVPPARSVRAIASSLGIAVSGYAGWDHFCEAVDEDHPSTMGASALRLALGDAGTPREDLRIVVFTGMSRDYPPSWSVATEIMRLLGIPDDCLGVDLTVGCLGSLIGLETARTWLLGNGGGCAAVVAAERWSHTVSRADASASRIWSHSDGAGAVVVSAGQGSGGTATLGRYRGACFVSHSAFNGHIVVPHGGTRSPVAPPGESPFTRVLHPRPVAEVLEVYRAGYGRTLDAARARWSFEADGLICNQISPKVVGEIRSLARVAEDRVALTGPAYGHLGSADVLVGLDHLRRTARLRGRIAIAASTPYSFGAGLIEPPA